MGDGTEDVILTERPLAEAGLVRCLLDADQHEAAARMNRPERGPEPGTRTAYLEDNVGTDAGLREYVSRFGGLGVDYMGGTEAAGER
jgi:hypothetical protein